VILHLMFGISEHFAYRWWPNTNTARAVACRDGFRLRGGQAAASASVEGSRQEHPLGNADGVSRAAARGHIMNYKRGHRLLQQEGDRPNPRKQKRA